MRRAFETPLGQLWLHGAPQAFDDARPVVLAISGAFAPADAFDRLQAALPEAACFIAHLPGNHAPLLSRMDLAGFIAAFDEVVARIGRPTVACGSSLGGLVALGLRAANLRGVVALDPPLTNSLCGPLTAPLRDRLAAQPANRALAEFLLTFFGVTPDAVEARDFLWLLEDLAAPTTVIAGDGPSELPSLMDASAREACRTHERISLTSSQAAGHNLVYEDPAIVLAALRERLAAV